MERVRVITLAAVVAAMVLLGVGYVVHRGTTPGRDAGPAGAADDEVSDASVPVARAPEPHRESRRVPLVRQPPEQRPERRGGPTDDDREVGNAEVIGGTAGGPSQLGRSGSARPGERGDSGGSGELRGPGGAPTPASGGSQAPERHQSSQAAEQRPADGAAPGSAPVLLSIPLKGSVDPEQGDRPTQSDGVVVDGDAVEFTAEAQYTLPAGGHVNGGEGSIAFDIEPRWDGSDETNNSLLQIRDPETWANNLQIVKNLDALRFVITDAAGVETDVVVSIADWQADQPHRVTATWGDSLMTLYIDGEPVGQSPFANGPTFRSTTPIHVGSDFPGSQYGSANGRISNLTIYGRALNAGEVK